MSCEAILNTIAPCGLNCIRCFAHAQGAIRKLSADLAAQLGAFDRYAERFASFLPVFRGYPQFGEVLSYLARGSCTGCRSGTCHNAECRVRTCHREQKVDFCFQCCRFPCEQHGLGADLKLRWIRMNERMREIGIEAYLEETMNEPRYR